MDGFLEELIVRRELSDNFCTYEPNYDNLGACSEWAIDSLNKHRGDKREFIYTLCAPHALAMPWLLPCMGSAATSASSSTRCALRTPWPCHGQHPVGSAVAQKFYVCLVTSHAGCFAPTCTTCLMLQASEASCAIPFPGVLPGLRVFNKAPVWWYQGHVDGDSV